MMQTIQISKGIIRRFFYVSFDSGLDFHLEMVDLRCCSTATTENFQPGGKPQKSQPYFEAYV